MVAQQNIFHCCVIGWMLIFSKLLGEEGKQIIIVATFWEYCASNNCGNWKVKDGFFSSLGTDFVSGVHFQNKEEYGEDSRPQSVM